MSVGKRGPGAIAGVAGGCRNCARHADPKAGLASPARGSPLCNPDPRRRCRWLRPEAWGTPSVASGRVVLGLGSGTGAAACQSVHQPPSPTPRHGTARRRAHRHRDPNARMTRLSTLKRRDFVAVSCSCGRTRSISIVKPSSGSEVCRPRVGGHRLAGRLRLLQCVRGGRRAQDGLLTGGLPGRCSRHPEPSARRGGYASPAVVRPWSHRLGAGI